VRRDRGGDRSVNLATDWPFICAFAALVVGAILVVWLRAGSDADREIQQLDRGDE
jgi:hypothetical protein